MASVTLSADAGGFALAQGSALSGPVLRRLYAGGDVAGALGTSTGMLGSVNDGDADGQGGFIFGRSLSVSSAVLKSSNGGVSFAATALPVSPISVAVAYGAGLWVAATSDGDIYTSPTASGAGSWTVRDPDTTGELKAVRYTGGKFVAVGANGAVTISDDGVTWAATAAPTSNGLRIGVTDGTVLLVTRDGLNRFYRSDDMGATWGSETTLGSGPLLLLTWANGLFVAASAAGIHTSPDGVTWTQRWAWSGTATLMCPPIWTGTRFAALFSHTGRSRLLTSPDGVSWRDAFNVESPSMSSIAAGGGVIAAIGGGSYAAYTLTEETAAQSFGLAGGAAALAKTYRLGADGSSFTLGLSAAQFARGVAMVAASGQFALGLPGAGYRRGYRVSSEAGSISLLGRNAGALRGALLPASTLAVAWSGFDVDTLRSRAVAAYTGAFAASADPASIVRYARLSGARGEFVSTAFGAVLAKVRYLRADGGQVEVDGLPARLRPSRLAPAFDVAIRPTEDRTAVRPAELRTATREAEIRVVSRPQEMRTGTNP